MLNARRFAVMVRMPVVLALATGLAGLVRADSTGEVLTQDTFALLAEKTLPSVVAVYVKTDLGKQMREMREKMQKDHQPFFNDPKLREFFNEPEEGGEGQSGDPDSEGPRADEDMRQTRASGSGVLISADGYIVSNLHIVQGAPQDSISVVLHDDYEIKPENVRVVATDDLIDLAILKVDAGSHPLPAPIPWGDSDKMRIGDWVVAIGNPLDLRGTVSQGIVSAKSRKIDKVPIEHLIQTDAMINPGNSGGALVNLKGELIGINMAIATNSGFFQGIGFAIPSNDARFVADQVIEHGRVRRGYIGIHMLELDPKLNEALDLGSLAESGVVVTDVVSGAPADKAGVKTYDVITAVDGEKIKATSDLLGIIAGKRVGDKARLSVVRKGDDGPKEVALTMEVTERPASNELSKQQEELMNLQRTTRQPGGEEDAVTRMGLTLEPVSATTVKGLSVTAVRSRSAAAKAGIRPGDVIFEINRVKVSTVAECNKALAAAGKKTSLLRLLQDGGFRVKSLAPPPSVADDGGKQE